MKNIIELFAGSQSFSNVARLKGFKTFTSDIADMPGIDYPVDILDFDVEMVPFIPDAIWASPDCSTWSKASGNLHFDAKSLTPKTQKAKKSFLIIDKTIEIIFHFLNLNPDLKYYIENPRGRMQKYLQAGTLFGKIPRLIVLDQCQYGREYQKTTHIFTNDIKFRERRRCPGIKKCGHQKNFKNHGDSKINKNGWLSSNYYERAKIPFELCDDILSNI